MMALSIRFRRALFLSSSSISLIKHNPTSLARPSSSPSPFSCTECKPIRPATHALTPSHSFRSSPVSFDRPAGNSGDGKIGPEEILFEGCDYNHWLITMDFPKDPKPTPEQMVETYVETLAKVVGSREEAMKRMYACSTTTYHGFQAVMTEEMSEKFRGLPGVVFILPDSYIDPINKEYGGDKYEMGHITPRPPPVQYGRQGRYGDRSRNYDRPRYDRPRDSFSAQQGNIPYDRQGPMQGDNRNYAPQQHYGSAGQQGLQYNNRQPSMQGYGANYPPQQSQYVPSGPQAPHYNNQQSPTQGYGANYPQQQNRYPTSPQGVASYPNHRSAQSDANCSQQGYGQSGGGAFSPLSGVKDYVPGGRDNYQVERSPTESDVMNSSQGHHRNIETEQHGGFSQRQFGGHENSSTFSRGDYKQGPTTGDGLNPGPEAQNYQAINDRSQGQY